MTEDLTYVLAPENVFGSEARMHLRGAENLHGYWTPQIETPYLWNPLSKSPLVLTPDTAWSCPHTHTHQFNGHFSGTTQVSRYQKGKTNLDFTEARDSEWHWHQLGHMQVSTSLQTDNHASTPPLSFLQAGCPSCRPTNSIKALKAQSCPQSLKISLKLCKGWATETCLYFKIW